MTIDHLRVDYRITVLREFTDAADITMRASETGVIRDMSWDQLRDEIFIEIERDTNTLDANTRNANTRNAERVRLRFSLKAQSGPRNGHMREFFEIGEYAPLRNIDPVRRDPIERKMIVPPAKIEQTGNSLWWREARNTAGPDRQEDVEKSMRAEIQHIGVAASIAEMYAQRMRAFQAEGNEPRAIAAFKLADEWMSTYASWATSGGEGAALSRERDEFHDALVKEFGYDPTIAEI
jgi:hypothetical protein